MIIYAKSFTMKITIKNIILSSRRKATASLPVKIFLVAIFLGNIFSFFLILMRSIHTSRDFFLDIQELYLQYFTCKKETLYQYLNKDGQVISWVTTIVQKHGRLLMDRG